MLCLFSSVGYLASAEELSRAVACMTGHLNRPGILIVEPWLTPETYEPGRVQVIVAETPDEKVARMMHSARDGRKSVLSAEYLVGTASGIERLQESHVLTLFTDEEYAKAFAGAGLQLTRDEDGLMGRGLLIGSSDHL